MQFTETTTAKVGEDTYTNNLENNTITCNDETIFPFSILDITGNNITIKQGIHIFIIQNTRQLQPVIEAFTQEAEEKPKKKTNKKTSKSTIKGKKQNDTKQ